MARASSKSSDSTGKPDRNIAPPEGAEAAGAGAGPDAIETSGDSLAAAPDSPATGTAPADIGAESPSPTEDAVIEAEGIAGDGTPDTAKDAAPDTGPDTALQTGQSAPPPPAAPRPPVEDAAPAPAGGGILPMVLGGLVAGALGYGAAYMGVLPGAERGRDQSARIAEALAPLQDQIAALAAATPAAPPPAAPVDLSPVIDQIAALSARLDATTDGIAALSTRLAALEDRPMPTGAADPDATAAQTAADTTAAQTAADTTAAQTAAETTAAALAAELEAERAAAAARAAELEAAAEAATSEAEAAIAAAQAEADAATAAALAALARADAEAALGEVQAAIATGAPFAEPLARIAATTPPPEALQGVADTGVATLASLQGAFAPLARAALPVALRETAGAGLGDRLGAFVMGQIGGRSVEPRAGDDPDAVLSRVEAAVRAGDLAGALAEIAALPEAARSVLGPWIADVEARAAAEAGLAALTAALGADSN